jgi:hypothetical protein
LPVVLSKADEPQANHEETKTNGNAGVEADDEELPEEQKESSKPSSSTFKCMLVS